jgi:hypothetical protein
VLLKLLVEAFVPSGPVIVGLDETIERRRGRKLTARAIYRDAEVLADGQHLVEELEAEAIRDQGRKLGFQVRQFGRGAFG